jgi:hypothetical protein
MNQPTNALITFEHDGDRRYTVNYLRTVKGELIEFEAALLPYNTGRIIDHNFELLSCTDDESEAYFSEHWEAITDEIKEQFSNYLSKKTPQNLN